MMSIRVTGTVITEADLPKIEEKMKELARKKSAYTRKDISKKDVIGLFYPQRVMNTNSN